MHSYINRKLLAVLCVGCFKLGSAAETLDTITVTSSRIENDVKKLSINATIITQDEIASSPAKTLSEVLASQVGINVRSLFGNYSSRATVDLRGFGASATQNTLILLDGRRLNDIDNAPVDLAAIPLSNIERIEILRGGGAVLYGDGASGGSINIVTKQADAQDIQGQIEIAGGSYDTRKAETVFSASLDRFLTNLSFVYIDSNGYRNNNSLEQIDAQGDFRWRADQGEFFLKLGLDDQELELPGGRTVDPVTGLNELDDDRKGTATADDFAEQNGYLISLGMQRFLGETVELILDGGVRRKNQEAFLNFGGGFTSFIDTELQTWSLTPRIDWQSIPFGINAGATLGVDFYYSDYDSNRALNASTTPIRDLEVNQSSIAIYAQSTFEPLTDLSATLGARAQRIDLSARDNVNPAAPGSEFGSEADNLDRDDTEFTYEAGLQYQFTDQLAAYTHVTRNVRFATVDELFELDASFAQIFSELEPQTGHVGDIGLKYDSTRYDFSGGFYYAEYRNEIYFDPIAFTNINLDPTRRYGVELSVTVRPADDINISTSYTYTQAEFDGGPNEGNKVPLVPQNAASMSLAWDILPALTASTVVNYTDSRRFDNDQANSFGRTIPSYITTDLKLSSRWRDWFLNMTISNLTNEKVFDLGVASTFTPGRFSAFPLPERNFLVSLGKSF